MIRDMIFRTMIVICVFYTTACSTFQVRIDFDTDFEFSESATYVWDVDPRQAENLSVQRFRSAVKAVLFEKRMKLAFSPQTAPLAVRLHVLTEDRKEVRPIPSFGSWGGGSNDLYLHDYELEWFVIEFIQTDQKRIVWEGKASARILNNLTPQERDLRADEAARELLKVFPPVRNLD
jgi:hypothetical protein